MYEAAIRHWDGYWFGKRKLYGDTYPHYWSALTVNAYKEWEQITGQRPYGERAEAAYRAVLSLIHGVDSGQHDAVYFSCRGRADGNAAHTRDAGIGVHIFGIIFVNGLHRTFSAQIPHLVHSLLGLGIMLAPPLEISEKSILRFQFVKKKYDPVSRTVSR